MHHDLHLHMWNFALQEVDDFMIRRFLRARDLDIEKASNLLLKYLNWRRTFIPKGYISQSDIPNQFEDNKVCMQGIDKKGRPIVVAFGGKHYPSKGSVEDFKRMSPNLFTSLLVMLPQAYATSHVFPFCFSLQD